ncbi:MAG: hypothetical protein R3F35_00540 [Myxococcota bacterium]
MTLRRLFPRSALRLLVLGWVALAAAPSARGGAAETPGRPPPAPPSPVDILNRRDLEAPFLDAVPLCVPRSLDGVADPVVEKALQGAWKEAERALARWSGRLEAHAGAFETLDAVFEARQATKRSRRIAAEERLAALLQDPNQAPQAACLRLERARLLLLIDRAPEAGGQLRRLETGLDASDAWDRARLAEVAFLRAEATYLAGRRFDAHLKFRRIAGQDDPRLALAARLRLTDLSFDAGKIEQVSVEYESMLPRASAFGASLEGWSLRASEAALDAGDPVRALRWLERYVEATSDRDARDVAEIRHADLEARLDDPMAARKRLAALVVRRGGDPIGDLAAVRAVDLGVQEGSADDGLDVVAKVVDAQRDGLRRYALGVLLRELMERDAYDQAVAVATRLAFDGVDPVVVPDYDVLLERLLARALDRDAEACTRSVRALGGRYGILIERASAVAPFARLGQCFEEMELPWLALPVYRAISRRFGAVGAADVAVALARASLATGDVSLARNMAEAALQETSPETPLWQAIVAEADFLEGRPRQGASRARAVLDGAAIGRARSRLALALARSLATSGSLDDARFLAERLPVWLETSEDDPQNREHLRLLEAGLLTAHALRRGGDPLASFAVYRAVDRAGIVGPIRSSARFWLGLARQPDAAGHRAWGGDVDRDLVSPWSKLAGFEERFEPLRDVYAEVLR